MSLPITPPFTLKGKRALVTGGTSGIGLGAAAALAQAQADVTIMARNSAALEETKALFKKENLSIDIISQDITDVSSLENWITAQAPFQILVNSAGMARHSPAFDTAESDYDAVMALNLKATYFLTRKVAHTLKEAHLSGSIINISSQMARVGGPDRAVYAASKHALSGMVKSMAIEWGALGIRINNICPTFIKTPLAEQTLARPERRKWIEEKIKLGRVGEIEDIMGAVVFLASEASALVTGSDLLIDGGWTAE